MCQPSAPPGWEDAATSDFAPSPAAAARAVRSHPFLALSTLCMGSRRPAWLLLGLPAARVTPFPVRFLLSAGSPPAEPHSREDVEHGSLQEALPQGAPAAS